MPFLFLYNLIIILTAGLVAGVISKRLGIPMVIGYLLAGALIGDGLLGFLTHASPLPRYERVKTFVEEIAEESHERIEKADELEEPAPEEPATELLHPEEPAPGPAVSPEISDGKLSGESSGAEETLPPAAQKIIETTAQEKLDEVILSEDFQTEMTDELAHLGALFLLFSIGIHFAPTELFRMKKFLFVGGPLQMFGVILPIALAAQFFGGGWRVGLLVGFAASLSSTVLVFKSLEEYGQAGSPFGVRAIAILLFQDVAIAPILLILPILFSLGGNENLGHSLLMMAGKAFCFIAVVVGIRFLFTRRVIRVLAELKSVELTVLFTVVLLFGVCMVARQLELPAALGALAAGIALSENRMTHQISALTVPFRETFSAIFFVSLGALFDPHVLLDYPLSTLALLLGMLMLKTIAGGAAFRVLGLSKSASIAMGLGIAQLGELSFIVLQEGTFRADHPVLYQQLLFVALTSIILTPLFLRLAIQVIRKKPYVEQTGRKRETILPPGEGKRTAMVIGLGPIGRRITSFLEISGFDVCLIDMNPVNLQPYAQEGFRTISGDATQPSTLRNAGLEYARLVVITIPDDRLSMDVLQTIRSLAPECSVVVRCRYTANVAELKRAGADMVICEEAEAGTGLVRALEPLL